MFSEEQMYVVCVSLRFVKEALILSVRGQQSCYNKFTI